jgi:hypothetical protein
MDDGVDNPTCVFNTSAQFSKMAVDYYYEKVYIVFPIVTSNLGLLHILER